MPIPDQSPVNFGEQARALQTQLHIAIQTQLDAFSRNTGMTPSAVVVNMVNVTTLSGRGSQWAVAGVHVRFEV